MAFGFSNPNQVGPGVDKNGLQKKRFFLFFELFFRKFSKMVFSSLMYIIFMIPSLALTVLGFMYVRLSPLNLIGLMLGWILAGPINCGFAYLMRQNAMEQPIFIFHDFWNAVKKNYKQGFAFAALDSVVLLLIIVSYQFVFVSLGGSGILQYIILFGYSAIALVYIMMHYYVYFLMITFDLKISKLVTNALILSIMGLRSNLLTTFWLALLTVVPLVVFESLLVYLIYIIIVPIFLASFLWFIVAFNSFQHVYKHLVVPYYDAHPEAKADNPFGLESEEEEDDEPIFVDLGTLEPKAKTYQQKNQDSSKKTLS